MNVKRCIETTKKLHWVNWLKEASINHIYTPNKYICFAMPFIVDIIASPPSMNTHSKKQHLSHDHPTPQLENGMVILNMPYYFFSLPNTLDDNSYIHLIQRDLQDLTSEELADHKCRKKNQVRNRKMKRIREEVEKLV